MGKPTLIGMCFVTAVGVVVMVAQTAEHTVTPKDGFVPNAQTAIKIAVAVWEPIYEETKIAEESHIMRGLTRTAFGLWRARCPRLGLATLSPAG